jgi:hypothetical protein
MTTGETDIGITTKLVLGAVTVVSSGTAELKIDVLKPPAGIEALCVTFACVATIVGAVIAFRANSFSKAAVIVALAAAFLCGFLFSFLVAAAGLPLRDLLFAAALYVLTAGLLAYVISACEQEVARFVALKRARAAAGADQAASRH